MTLHSLRCFLTVAEEMNFRKAAAKLYITQQTLSAHIRRLEQRYGADLFERKPRLMLTPAGQCMVEYAKKAVKQEEYLIAELADVTGTTTGRLNMGITGIRGTIFMPRIWAIFHRLFPNITLSIREASTDRLDELLHAGEIELYIGVNAPERKGMEVENLANEKICCIASKKFVEGHFFHEGYDEKELLETIHRGVNLANLAQMPWVTFTKPNYLRMYLDEFFEAHALHPHIVCETSRHDLVLRFCEQGYGIGIIYQMLLYDMLQNRDTSGIYIFPVKNSFPRRYTNLVYRKESFKPSYFMKFVEITRSVFHEYAENINTLIEAEPF